MKVRLRPPVSEMDFMQGISGAPVTLVEYGDYECPHCAAAHPVIKQLKKEFGAAFCFVFRDFPLSNIHPQAVYMSSCARAEGRQYKFWEMHNFIFEHQSVFNQCTLQELAKILDIDKVLFAADVRDPAIKNKIAMDVESGVKSRVKGVPSFFINGIKYKGNNNYLEIRKAMELQSTAE